MWSDKYITLTLIVLEMYVKPLLIASFTKCIHITTK